MRRFGFVIAVMVVLGILGQTMPAVAQTTLKALDTPAAQTVVPVRQETSELGDCLDALERSGLLRTVYVRAVFDAEGGAISAYAEGDESNDQETGAYAAASVMSGMRISPSKTGEAKRELVLPVNIFVSFSTPEPEKEKE